MTRPPSSPPHVVDERGAAEELALALVDAARRLGASACDATVGTSASLSASARDGAIEDLSRAQSRGAAVRVIVDGRQGFATSSDAPNTPAEVEELARLALGLAQLTTTSPHNVVLAPTLTLSPAEIRAAGDALGIWDDETAELDSAWCTERALACERVCRGVDGVKSVRDVSASLRRGTFALATSTGFVGSTRGTSASISCSAVVDDGEKKQVDSYWNASRQRSALTAHDAEQITRTAAERALARRDARRIASETLPVIFDPQMARGFFAGVLGVLSGEAVARKQSYLADAVGSVILPAGYVLVDDPGLVGGFSSHAFDGEGQRAEKRVLVDDAGRLTGFLTDGRSAARLGLTSTGHAGRGGTSLPHASPTNTTLLGGHGDLASIIKETKRGLLVTKVLGRGADATTGDMSRAAAGFFIDDGAIAFPVEEVTIAGNARALLKEIDRVGADLDARSSLRVPSLRFAAMAVGGT